MKTYSIQLRAFLAENKIEFYQLQQNEFINVFLTPKLGEVYKEIQINTNKFETVRIMHN